MLASNHQGSGISGNPLHMHAGHAQGVPHPFFIVNVLCSKIQKMGCCGSLPSAGKLGSRGKSVLGASRTFISIGSSMFRGGVLPSEFPPNHLSLTSGFQASLQTALQIALQGSGRRKGQERQSSLWDTVVSQGHAWGGGCPIPPAVAGPAWSKELAQ